MGTSSFSGSVRGSQVPTHRHEIFENTSGRNLSQVEDCPDANKLVRSGVISKPGGTTICCDKGGMFVKNWSNFAKAQISTAVLSGLEALRTEFPFSVTGPPKLVSGMKFPIRSAVFLVMLSNNMRQSKLGFSDPIKGPVSMISVSVISDQKVKSEKCDAV